MSNEENFSSQDQKLVETTSLWQLYWDKNTPAQIDLCNDHYLNRTD